MPAGRTRVCACALLLATCARNANRAFSRVRACPASGKDPGRIRPAAVDAPRTLRDLPWPMLTSRALLLPSVPTMLIDEQRGDFTEMIEAVTAAGERLASESPDAIVALSARWVSAGVFHADDARAHRSVIDLPGFGVEPRYDCAGHPALARALVEGAARAGGRPASPRRRFATSRCCAASCSRICAGACSSTNPRPGSGPRWWNSRWIPAPAADPGDAMRVLMVNAFHWLKGGVERTVFDETRWLEAAGYEVAHFAIRDPRNVPSPFEEQFAPPADYGESTPAWRQLGQLARAIWSAPAGR